MLAILFFFFFFFFLTDAIWNNLRVQKQKREDACLRNSGLKGLVLQTSYSSFHFKENGKHLSKMCSFPLENQVYFVILFLCFSVLLVFRLPRLGKRELILVLFVRLFDLCLFGFVGFLFLLGSGKGCGLRLWHSLDFSLTFFWLLVMKFRSFIIFIIWQKGAPANKDKTKKILFLSFEKLRRFVCFFFFFFFSGYIIL